MSKREYIEAGQLLQAQNALEHMAQMPISQIEDTDVAFDLARIVRQILPEVEILRSWRLSLMREYGAVDKQGMLFFDDANKQDAFNRAYEEKVASLRRPLNLQPIPWSRFRAAFPALAIWHVAALEGIAFCRDGEPEEEGD